jgi:hypothetical protein
MPETVVTDMSATSRTGKPDNPLCQTGPSSLAGSSDSSWSPHEQDALKGGPSTDQPESSRGRIRPRSESSADGKAKPNAEISPESVAAG